MCLPNPSVRTGYKTRSNFKRSLTGLDLEFFLQDWLLYEISLNARVAFDRFRGRSSSEDLAVKSDTRLSGHSHAEQKVKQLKKTSRRKGKRQNNRLETAKYKKTISVAFFWYSVCAYTGYRKNFYQKRLIHLWLSSSPQVIQSLTTVTLLWKNSDSDPSQSGYLSWQTTLFTNSQCYRYVKWKRVRLGFELDSLPH